MIGHRRNRHSRGVHYSMSAMDHGKLTKGFCAVRKLGIVAKQNFLCCNGCGLNELSNRHKAGKFPGKRGYIFYHNQNYDRMKETGKVCIYFGTFDESDSVPMAMEVKAAFESVGLSVDWNGTEIEAMKVS